MHSRPRKSDVWTMEVELKFIEFMKNNPCTWDHWSQDYNRSDIKKLVYQEAAALLGSPFTADMVKERWTNMKSTFTNNYKKYNALKKDNNEPIPTPSWPLYSRLLFLKPIIARKSSLNSSTASQITDPLKIESQEEEEEEGGNWEGRSLCKIGETSGSITVSSGLDQDSCDYQEEQQTTTATANIIRSTPSSSSYYGGGRENSFAEESNFEVSARNQGICPIPSQAKEVIMIKEEDEWDDFGKMVAKILRKMPEAEARQMQMEFFRILCSRPNIS